MSYFVIFYASVDFISLLLLTNDRKTSTTRNIIEWCEAMRFI